MDNQQKVAISFDQVSYQIDDISILKDITGNFYKGKITTLVGPSGAGKTTLLKMCNGLISPTSGNITIENKPIQSYEPTALRRLVGIASQSAPVIRGTVYENLSLPLTLQNETLSKEHAISFLDDVGLNETFLFKHATELSGGQRQKVSIARTLVNRSNILLLDEITSALDPTSVHEIEELILKINKKYNVTMIWITHNIEQAKKLGDYTWVMMNGQLIESGESTLLTDSSNVQIQHFVEGGPQQ